MIHVGDYCLNHHRDISSQAIIILFTPMTCILHHTKFYKLQRGISTNWGF